MIRLIIILLFLLTGCGPQLFKCALQAKIDFHSGSTEETKRLVVGYVRGVDQLHVQAEIYQNLTWYPISRYLAYEMDPILGIYFTWEAFERNWPQHRGP